CKALIRDPQNLKGLAGHLTANAVACNDRYLRHLKSAGCTLIDAYARNDLIEGAVCRVIVRPQATDQPDVVVLDDAIETTVPLNVLAIGQRLQQLHTNVGAGFLGDDDVFGLPNDFKAVK